MRCFRPILPLVVALMLPAVPSPSFAQTGACGPSDAEAVGIAAPVTTPPPALPVYTQPPIPDPGYIWTPGYWSNGSAGYYWVPGTWVQPPSVGLLWTPGYWGSFNGAFIFTAGYWGAHIGFYGGVNYGFGYGGAGYAGGYWQNGAFFYNRSVNNFGSVHITNVYNKTVINNTTINRVSYNGGTGGTTARPTAAEEAGLRESHTPPTAAQTQHFVTARSDPTLRASVNHGNPPIAATGRPGEFKEGVVASRGAAPAAEGHPAPGAEVRPPAAVEAHPTPDTEGHPSVATEGHPVASTETGPPAKATGQPPGASTGEKTVVSHAQTPEVAHPTTQALPETHTASPHPSPAQGPSHQAAVHPAVTPHPGPILHPAAAPHPAPRPAPKSGEKKEP